MPYMYHVHLPYIYMTTGHAQTQRIPTVHNRTHMPSQVYSYKPPCTVLSVSRIGVVQERERSGNAQCSASVDYANAPMTHSGKTM